MQKRLKLLIALVFAPTFLLLAVMGCGIEKSIGPRHGSDADTPRAEGTGGAGRTAPDPGNMAERGKIPERVDGVPRPGQADDREHVFTVKLAAVGDVLIHSSIYKDAKTKEGYNFIPMFARVKPYIEEADLAMVNQESMIGGEEIGLSDYPRFNSPYEIGDALKAAGFDIVNLANNHTLDRGEEAVTNAIRHWRELGMVYTGAYLSADDRQQIRVVSKNGITLAFLSYTYGTNGIPVPEGKPYLVNLIDPRTVAEDIAKARELADVVVVSMHFGQEYARMPNDRQKQWARAAAEAGADIVIGHHPHVLQPAEWVETSSGRRTFVVYSLGNFLAAQQGEYERTGGILQLEVRKKVEGKQHEITVQNPSFIPTWIEMTGWRHYNVIPLREATDEQLKDGKSFAAEIQNHMSRWLPELRFP